MTLSVTFSDCRGEYDVSLRNMATEMALHVLAYNIKRVIAILGVQELLQAI